MIFVAIHFQLRNLYQDAKWLLKSAKRTVVFAYPRVRWLITRGSGLESSQDTFAGDT